MSKFETYYIPLLQKIEKTRGNVSFKQYCEDNNLNYGSLSTAKSRYDRMKRGEYPKPTKKHPPVITFTAQSQPIVVSYGAISITVTDTASLYLVLRAFKEIQA